LIDIVLDASVILKWFAPPEERYADEAQEIQRSYRAGETIVTVPSLLFLELLNVAGRRWSWNEDALTQLASALDEIEFEVGEVELVSIASWTSRGLTAYDAAYVALAEARGVPLVTDDDTILSIAPNVARALGS
jgi:predicted nucleic acid-binding protein